MPSGRMALVSSETARAPRSKILTSRLEDSSLKHHPVFADFAVRDIQKRLTSSDNHLLRRWERIALECRA